jgi:beta-lactamase class A
MKRRIRTIWAGVLCLSPVLALQAGWGDLQEQLRRMVADKKAQVGIAVILDGRDTLTVNNDVRYPMMSVFKFHQALAVADACGQRGVSFDTLVHVRPDDLHPDTYSPLRDKYPDGNLSLSVGELLKYTLHLSDNNACDILFRVFGGPAATDEYLRSMGLRDFAIEVTEDDMHRDLADCYRNWTTPLEAVRMAGFG